MAAESIFLNSNAWEVFSLFLIPIGGGIPAGVILAKNRGLTWPVMMLLYFASDVVLAFVFEGIILLLARIKTKSPFLARLRESFRTSVQNTTARYGVHPGPISLILISFGVDPMTGRTAALMAGHGFITGWLIAITGDLIFFAAIMISTLWLNNILGDGTWTAVIIMVAMIAVPALIRRVRGPWAAH